MVLGRSRWGRRGGSRGYCRREDLGSAHFVVASVFAYVDGVRSYPSQGNI